MWRTNRFAASVIDAAAKPDAHVGGTLEQHGREVGAVARSQNAVYVMPHDWAAISQFLAPLVDRVEDGVADVQLLVIASDPDVAAAIAAAAVRLADQRSIGIVAATAAGRAERLLRARPAQIVAGTAEVLSALLRASALKLNAVESVCIAWADELVTRESTPALEAVMTEAPKESARVIVAAELTPGVEELIERYARRARRVAAGPSETNQPLDVEYVATSAATKLPMLRRVLDELNPPSALVFVREPDSELAVRDLLRSLGYARDDEDVRVGRATAPGTSLAVCFDLPASREELREAAAGAARRILLVQPRQVPSVRALAAGGLAKSFTLPEVGERARGRDARTRASLRQVLDEGHFGRELLALEPLLEDYDAAEIAAAALVLAERERAARETESRNAASAPTTRTPAKMTRLFLAIGTRDNVQPGDIVGAIANQAGISSTQIGKLDVRESHSTIEVASDVAAQVIERANNMAVRGRRMAVRLDEERPRRAPREGRPGRDRGGDRGGDRDRPRGRDRGPGRDRPAGRERPGRERPAREPYARRGGRGDRE